MEHTKPTRSRKPRVPIVNFDLPVNGRSYAVTASPHVLPSGEIQYRVSYNESPIHVFGFDEGLNRYAETDTMADVIPPVIEMAIAKKLEEVSLQLRDAA